MVYDKPVEGITVCLRSIKESDAEISFKMRTDPQKAKFVHPVKERLKTSVNISESKDRSQVTSFS